MEQRNIRLVAVGDDLLAGVGDPRTLGWFGRVMARTPHNNASITAYNLAAPTKAVICSMNAGLKRHAAASHPVPITVS
ncbi:lipolytic enzyme G-D-S-L [Rothia aeria]|uniref:Lipolytic enzyme G-D-S-L n=1 Tax=Rothia aeria TaxID=172042 RepID=A0A2Z5R1W1_9MICC|nr:lipolytic enzyme G-D-S-L [Rothia aeria]